MKKSPQDSGKDEYLSVEETAKKLKLAPITIYRMIYRNELPAVKFGRSWRISSKMLTNRFNN